MATETKQPVRPNNIFEAINQNIVEMSQDNVAMFRLIQGLSAKIDEIYAVFCQTPTPEEEPKRTGEDTGFENE